MVAKSELELRKVKDMDSVTVETYEENQEPRYVVIVRGALILSVALAATKADAHRAIEPYKDDSTVTTSIKSLPISSSDDQADLSDLLASMTRTVTHISIRETVSVTASVTRKVVPREEPDQHD